jgi:DtxR family Mn-dependent transcriptional regulator
MEDYLEAIALLKKERGAAKVADIARRMNVKNPSVNAAVRSLARRELVVHERYGLVHLTARGRAIAERVVRRHEMLVRFLTEVLGVREDAAREDACKMEHVLGDQTFDRLRVFMRTNKISGPRAKVDKAGI